MKALVTGAAGFIGSHLSERLVAEGAPVIGLDCFTDYYARGIKERNLEALAREPRFTLVESRIQDVDLPQLLVGVTHVFHLAAQAGVRKSWGTDFRVYTENNIEATQVLLEACTKAAHLDRLVYASSSSVYGDDVPLPFREDQRLAPVSPYGVTKLAAEHLCQLYWLNHRVPAVSLRYFTVYGPRQRPDMGFHRFCAAALSNRTLKLYGDGEQTRDFTFVADAVSATLAAGRRGVAGRVYNIGGGARVTVNQVLTLIEQLARHPLNITREDAQKGDMRDTFADTSLARRDLGYAPSVALTDGLAAEYRWLAAQAQDPR